MQVTRYNTATNEPYDTFDLTDVLCDRISTANGMTSAAHVRKALEAGQRIYTAFSYYQAAKLPTYAELIAVLENSQSVRSIAVTEKRVTVLVKALRIADAGVVEAIEDLLSYTGGWDLPLHSDHPITKARIALFRAGVVDHETPAAMAAVERFDLHSLTASQLTLLRDIRRAPQIYDNHEVGPNQRLLKELGLVTIEWTRPDLHPKQDHTVTITITDKGRNAR